MNKLVLLFLLCNFVYSQTTTFNVSWDANVEPDVHSYQIFKDTSPGANVQVSNILHPTTIFVDNNIQRGVIYYYRLKASDSTGNQSGYSNEVSAAIPNIINTSFTFQNQITNIVLFNDLFIDPDNINSEDVLEISNEFNLNVIVLDDYIRITPVPSTYVGSASFVLKVDDGEFFDQQTITVDFSNTIPSAPQNVIITR